MPKKLCAILLAAGNSSRFGSNKLLYPINNQPMYQHTVNLIKKLQPEQIILVTKYPEIYKKIDPNISLVINHATYLGQSYSMYLGLQTSLARKSPIDGYLFTVCDQPYLTFTSLKKLYTTWQQTDGICALSYNRKRGNPVIFSHKYIQELLAVKGDQGGRIIINQHLNELTLVEVTSPQELIDIDTLSVLK